MLVMAVMAIPGQGEDDAQRIHPPAAGHSGFCFQIAMLESGVRGTSRAFFGE